MRFLFRTAIIGVLVLTMGHIYPGVRSLWPDEQITLSWSRNGEADLMGYRVYFGTVSGQYDHIEEADLDTSYVVAVSEDTAYYFVVTAYDTAGNESDFSDEVNWKPDGTVGIGDDMASPPGLPKSYQLSQNYPNPFNPSTAIQYAIADNGSHQKVRTTLVVYSLRGQAVRTLVDEEQSAGEYRVHWGGEGDRGEMLASGTYLYRLQAGDYSSTRKMVLGK